MNRLAIIISLTLMSILGATAQNTIKIEMTNFENDRGVVRIGLVNKAEDFLKTTYKSTDAKIVDNKATAVFENIPDGIYAINLFHDEDSDNKLKMFMGLIPKEDYGTSNNAPANFGPPKWEDAKFEVKGGETVTQKINLH